MAVPALVRHALTQWHGSSNRSTPMTKTKNDDIFPTLNSDDLTTCVGGNQGHLTQNAIQSQQNAAQNLIRSGVRPGGGGGGGNEMPVN